MATAIDGSDYSYDSDKLALTCLIRMGPDEGAAYSAGGGTVETPLHAFNGGSRRKFGVHARGLRLKRTIEGAVATDPPTSIQKYAYTFFPVGNLATYNTIKEESLITVGGNEWVVKKKVDETVT